MQQELVMINAGKSLKLTALPWRWSQQRPPKFWRPITSLHGVTNPEDRDIGLILLVIFW